MLIITHGILLVYKNKRVNLPEKITLDLKNSIYNKIEKEKNVCHKNLL